MKKIFIRNIFDTAYTNSLVALGLAELIENIYNQNEIGNYDIKIKNLEGLYVLSVNPEIKEEDIENLEFQPIFPYMKHKDEEVGLHIDKLKILDYADEEIEFSDYSPSMKKLQTFIPRGRGNPWPNKIINRIYELKDKYHLLVKDLLVSLSNQPGSFPFDKLDEYFKNYGFRSTKRKFRLRKEFSPSQIKGMNSADLSRDRQVTNALNDRNELKGGIFPGYLIIAGFYHNVFQTNVQKNDRDDIIYSVIIPEEINYQDYKELVDTATNNLDSSGASYGNIVEENAVYISLAIVKVIKKLDINLKKVINKLSYCQLHYYSQSYVVKSIFSTQISDWLQNFEVAETLQNLIRYTNTKFYPDIAINSLEFLSNNTLDNFFSFISSYIDALIFDPSFNKTFEYKEVKEIMPDKDLMEVVDSEEFKEFTRLIKQNTYNQIVYGDGSNTKWDLINKLKEGRESKEKLIEVISNLISSHSMEKAKKEAKTGNSYLAAVKFNSTKKIIEWIESYGSATIANLILSFGLTWTEEELEKFGDDEEENTNNKENEGE